MLSHNISISVPAWLDAGEYAAAAHATPADDKDRPETARLDSLLVDSGITINLRMPHERTANDRRKMAMPSITRR